MKTRLYLRFVIIVAIGLTSLSCEGPTDLGALDDTHVEVGDFNLDHAARQSTLECTKQHPCNRLSLGFDPAISGVRTDLDGLTEVLRRYTSVEVLAPKKASQVIIVYGIGHGEEVYGPFVSGEIVMVSGEPTLIGRGHGPIASAWEVFEDPVLGFEDPLLGFEDPLLGFGRPLNGIWGTGNVGFSDPLLGLNAIWGTGNVGIDPDEYGLVIFSMSVGKGGAPVLHNASILPFHATE